MVPRARVARMADEGDGARQQRHALGHQRIALDDALPRAGADGDGAFLLAHIG